MATKMETPEYDSERGFEHFKQECTSIEKKKQGMVSALSLPKKTECGICELVLDKLGKDKLCCDDGMKNLCKFLTEKLGKDELDDSLERFEDFDSFQRSNEMTIIEFITKFDRKYQRLARGSMTIPLPILAFMMLKKVGISANDKKLVLSGMDYSKRDTLYEQANKSLRKVKGEHCYGSGSASGSSNGSSVAIKVEPVNYTQSEHGQTSVVFFTRGGYWGNSRGYRGKAMRGRQWHSTVGSVGNGKDGKFESHGINRYQGASQSYRGASRARKVNS